MTFNHIKAGLIGLFIGVCSFQTSFGQDLIARQAPIDRKMKAVDSVALQKLIEQEQEQIFANIYPMWDNEFRRRYAGVEVPDSFRIDLRNFCMPTPSRLITSNYGYRRSYRRMHRGLDVKVYTGDTIKAAFSGKVRIVKYDRGGYGNYVVLRHPNGLETIYGHLSKQLVNEDEVVEVGQPIGLGGNTGRSSGSHLHFEILFLGQAIDPVLLFDFPNQDVTGDYFVWYKDKQNIASNNSKTSGGNAGSNGSSVSYHKVKSGENLSIIAKKRHTTIEKLCSLNRITRTTKLRPGQILRYSK